MTVPTSSRSRTGVPDRIPSVAAWALFILLIVFVALFGVDRARGWLLAQDAEQTAVKYAQFIGDAVPGLTPLLGEGRASRATLEELRRLRYLGEVFRFKLFDRDGAQLLVSDDLDAADPMAVGRDQKLGGHQGNDLVGRIVFGGRNYVSLEDGRGVENRPDTYSEAYVPLSQNGELIGVIEVYVDQSARAERIDLAFLAVACTVGLLLLLIGSLVALQVWLRQRERRRSDAKIRFLAEHDPLTGALNRDRFARQLERAARNRREGGAGFSILCIDLDRFKEVNDTLGHGAGDDVLCQVAARLRRLVRHDDEVARLGGDEFAVLFSGVSDAATIGRLAQGVVDALAEPIDADGHRVPCGASVGVARFEHDALEVPELLHKADLAMYRSKREGRGQFSFYDAELDHALEQRRRLTLELRSAIADGQLSPHFQPLYASGAAGKLTGYEALMRWHHPERGMVPPSEFIPLAEETGLIEEIGTWMLRAACAEAARWPEELHVAVNLSAVQFHGRRPLPKLVREILEETGLAPTRLELEITESLLMSNAESVLETLEELSRTGVRIALDDFGTGYSSLSYLWRFPFDKVKIDRSFTMGLDTDEKAGLIVRSIITMAHSMGIRVNAEGVETEAQRSALNELGCDELQGFLLGRPGPIDELQLMRRAA